ncbi:MAG: amidohydrolase family protein [Chitinophagaceae bacterium]
MRHVQANKIHLLLSFFLLSATAHAQQIAFVNVNVVPMDKEQILSNQTVLVTNGRITAIGKTEKIKIPKATKRINGTGKYLMPGLADIHVHIGYRPVADTATEVALVMFVANGVTTVRNMWGHTPVIFDLKREIESGRKLGPQIFSTGPVTDGRPPFRRDARIVESVEQADSSIRSDKNEGYIAFKAVDNLTLMAFRAIMSSAKKYHLPVVGHVPNSVTLQEALSLGMYSIEHFYGYRIALQSDTSPYKGIMSIKNMDYIDIMKIPEVVKQTKVAGTWNCPTMVTSSLTDTFTDHDVDNWLQRPYVKYLSRAANWATEAKKRNSERSEEDKARFVKRYHLHAKLIKLLSDNECGLLIGSDAPKSFVPPGFSIFDELEIFVNAGLTPYQALRAATTEPARFLNKQHEFGRVAVGMRADLILLNGNPLEDIKNAAMREGVMVKGRWFTEDQLVNLLEQILAQYRRRCC